ncbi:MAG: ribosome maturation factor RimP [Actinomycetota bacterium]|nr:ribosome maturation factor RimP [Actinomycetota bacterium]
MTGRRGFRPTPFVISRDGLGSGFANLDGNRGSETLESRERRLNMSITRGSAQSSPVIDRVLALIQPIVSDLGLDLYDIEYTGGVLRVVVDTQPGGPEGVSLDNISLITRLVSREFDHSDPIPGRYTLEVSSPGLERTLREPRHFHREVGKVVSVKLDSPINGERRVQGDLIAASDEGITLRLADKAMTELTIPFDVIDRAKTVFNWGPAPKPGSKKSTEDGGNAS